MLDDLIAGIFGAAILRRPSFPRFLLWTLLPQRCKSLRFSGKGGSSIVSRQRPFAYKRIRAPSIPERRRNLVGACVSSSLRAMEAFFPRSSSSGILGISGQIFRSMVDAMAQMPSPSMPSTKSFGVAL